MTHSEHGTRSAETMLKDGSRDVEKRYPSELRLLEPLQAFDVPTIQIPGIVSVQKDGEYHCWEDHDLAFLLRPLLLKTRCESFLCAV